MKYVCIKPFTNLFTVGKLYEVQGDRLEFADDWGVIRCLNVWNEYFERAAAQERALELYPDPIRGVHTDTEDFEWRKLKAKLQREAYIKGRKEAEK